MITFRGSYPQAGTQTTRTFSGVNIGAPSANRLVIVYAYCEAGVTGGRTISSASIGGVSATVAIDSHVTIEGTASFSGAVFAALVPTGSTGNIVVEFSGATRRGSIAVYTTYADSATAHDSTLIPEGELDVPDHGVVVGGVGYANSTNNYRATSASRHFEDSEDNHVVDPAISGSTVNWSGLDEDDDWSVLDNLVPTTFIFGAAASYEVLEPDEVEGADSEQENTSTAGQINLIPQVFGVDSEQLNTSTSDEIEIGEQVLGKSLEQINLAAPVHVVVAEAVTGLPTQQANTTATPSLTAPRVGRIPKKRPSYRQADFAGLVNRIDPGPSYYDEYQFSGRTFRKRDVPGRRPENE